MNLFNTQEDVMIKYASLCARNRSRSNGKKYILFRLLSTFRSISFVFIAHVNYRFLNLYILGSEVESLQAVFFCTRFIGM